MKQLVLACLLSIPFGLLAQENTLPILCGNEAFDYIINHQYPAYRDAFRMPSPQAKTGTANRSPMTIRVVVHVVWKAPSENLPDSVILNQIAVLNEDYQRLNADSADLRPAFQPVAGNANIHFELADIVRVQTNATFQLDLFGDDLLSNLKHSAEGGSNAWDTESYLNIWVCKIQPTTLLGIPIGQILGFAFPPNNLNNWPGSSGAPSAEQDGVVIDYRVFGRNNPNSISLPGGGGNLVVRGRTPTHEVGHYLGLRHIWGDGGLLGPNDCSQSDGIDDTPFANAQSDFDCNKTRNTCNAIETFYGTDMPDLVENYMDYSSEDCMNMFTKGQVAMMISVLEGPRAGLLQSPSAVQLATQPDTRLQLYPNPAQEQVWAEFELPKAQTIQVQITAANGTPGLAATKIDLPAGSQQIPINLRGLAPGWYAVQVITASDVWVKALQVN